jgi:phytoene synthase
MDAAAHVASLVRDADPDRYLAALYAPEDRRRGLFVLYAFNAEISSIRDRVREPIAGEIRLQWWRDAIAAPTGELTGNPVADELRAAIAGSDLPLKALDDMLSARIFDLYDDPIPDRTTLEGYCGETASALIQLASLVLDPAAAARHAGLAGHAGCAQAMTAMLRSLPVQRARGQCFLPRDLLAAAGLTAEEFVSGEVGQGHERAVAAMAALAREHLEAFSGGAGTLPATLRPAYLAVAPVGRYLDRIARANPLTEIVGISALARHIVIFRRAMAGWP